MSYEDQAFGHQEHRYPDKILIPAKRALAAYIQRLREKEAVRRCPITCRNTYNTRVS
jgi:hypothetical protein